MVNGIIKSNLVMGMYIEGFGEKEITLYVIENTEELFELQFSDKDIIYSAVVDVNGRVLVPISEMGFYEAFSTRDSNNYCFTRLNEETNDYESFHLQKQEDGKFYLRADIKGNQYNNCRLIGTEKDNYWLIENTYNNITEVSLYDVRNAKILTPSFSCISFEKEKSRVLAYVEKELYGEIDGEMVYLTRLLSYIDYNGKFIAPLYDIDKEIDGYYDAMIFNYDNSFKYFNQFIKNITEQRKNSYINHNQHITEVLMDMYNNLYSEDDVNRKRKDAKILEFRKGNSND